MLGASNLESLHLEAFKTGFYLWLLSLKEGLELVLTSAIFNPVVVVSLALLAEEKVHNINENGAASMALNEVEELLPGFVVDILVLL